MNYLALVVLPSNQHYRLVEIWKLLSYTALALSDNVVTCHYALLLTLDADQLYYSSKTGVLLLLLYLLKYMTRACFWCCIFYAQMFSYGLHDLMVRGIQISSNGFGKCMGSSYKGLCHWHMSHFISIYF
jgi:hypothetical protein